MFQLFAGRTLQIKNYQRTPNSEIYGRAVGSYDFGVYLNPLYTPFYRLRCPIDVLLGYEFSRSDDQNLQVAPAVLWHVYHGNYLSGAVFLNLLPFVDIGVAGGVGLTKNIFRADTAGTPQTLENARHQAYFMPGVQVFYRFSRPGLNCKLGVFLKKELFRDWDMDVGQLGRFRLIDHSSAQVVVRLSLAYGRRPRKVDAEPGQKAGGPPPAISQEKNALQSSPGTPRAEDARTDDGHGDLPQVSESWASTIVLPLEEKSCSQCSYDPTVLRYLPKKTPTYAELNVGFGLRSASYEGAPDSPQELSGLLSVSALANPFWNKIVDLSVGYTYIGDLKRDLYKDLPSTAYSNVTHNLIHDMASHYFTAGVKRNLFWEIDASLFAGIGGTRHSLMLESIIDDRGNFDTTETETTAGGFSWYVMPGLEVFPFADFFSDVFDFSNVRFGFHFRWGDTGPATLRVTDSHTGKDEQVSGMRPSRWQILASVGLCFGHMPNYERERRDRRKALSPVVLNDLRAMKRRLDMQLASRDALAAYETAKELCNYRASETENWESLIVDDCLSGKALWDSVLQTLPLLKAYLSKGIDSLCSSMDYNSLASVGEAVGQLRVYPPELTKEILPSLAQRHSVLSLRDSLDTQIRDAFRSGSDVPLRIASVLHGCRTGCDGYDALAAVTKKYDSLYAVAGKKILSKAKRGPNCTHARAFSKYFGESGLWSQDVFDEVAGIAEMCESSTYTSKWCHENETYAEGLARVIRENLGGIAMFEGPKWTKKGYEIRVVSENLNRRTIERYIRVVLEFLRANEYSRSLAELRRKNQAKNLSILVKNTVGKWGNDKPWGFVVRNATRLPGSYRTVSDRSARGLMGDVKSFALIEENRSGSHKWIPATQWSSFLDPEYLLRTREAALRKRGGAAYTYFPSGKGSSWTYNKGGAETTETISEKSATTFKVKKSIVGLVADRHYEVRADGIYETGGQSLAGLAMTVKFGTVDSETRAWSRDGTFRYYTPFCVLKKSLPVGARWTTGEELDKIAEVIEYRNMTVPAGSFQNVLVVRTSTSKSGTYVLDYYAPDVGLIKCTVGGSEVFLLERYHIETGDTPGKVQSASTSYKLGSRRMEDVGPALRKGLERTLGGHIMVNRSNSNGIVCVNVISTKLRLTNIVRYIAEILEFIVANDGNPAVRDFFGENSKNTAVRLSKSYNPEDWSGLLGYPLAFAILYQEKGASFLDNLFNEPDYFQLYPNNSRTPIPRERWRYLD